MGLGTSAQPCVQVWYETATDRKSVPAQRLVPHSLASKDLVSGDRPSQGALPRLPDFCPKVTCRAPGVKEWDRHTDIMCLPSMAIVEREVRKS